MVTDDLKDRMGYEPNLSIKWSITIGTILNFDRDGDGMCKQALIGSNRGKPVNRIAVSSCQMIN